MLIIQYIRCVNRVLWEYAECKDLFCRRYILAKELHEKRNILSFIRSVSEVFEDNKA